MIAVLYIDDSPGLLREMKQFLERSGDFLVDDAGSGIHALTHSPFSGYDIIISAYELPGMNGVEILRTVREYDPLIPFILITNTPITYRTDDEFAQGADYVIQRQGSLFQLYEEISLKIKRSVKRRQRERKIRERSLKLQKLDDPYQDGNWVITNGGMIVYGGSEIASVLAISIEDLTNTGLFSWIKEEGRCRFLSSLESSKKKPVKKFEFELIRRDLRIRSMMSEEVKFFQNDSGEEIYVFVGISGISLLKNTDRILQKIDQICNFLLSTINGVLWTINTVFMKYTFVSSSCSHFFGYRAEDLIGGEISLTDMIITSRPVTEVLWDRAVSHLSSDNPPGLYSDRLPVSHYNGSELMTEVTSEFFLNEKNDVLMVRGFVRVIPGLNPLISENPVSEPDLIIREKIDFFLDTIRGKVPSVICESGHGDSMNLLEKVDLLRFASHHQCTWEWDKIKSIDLDVSDLSCCDQVRS